MWVFKKKVFLMFYAILVIYKANRILENMNDSVEPCEDFYEFSCGSFDRNKRLQEDQSKVDEFTILRDKLAYVVAGTFFLKIIFFFLIHRFFENVFSFV